MKPIEHPSLLPDVGISSSFGRLVRRAAPSPSTGDPARATGLAPGIQPYVDAMAQPSRRQVGVAAFIRLDGPLTNDPGWMWEWAPAITYAQAAKAIDQAAADPAVSRIVLDLHSPGGSVAGFSDLRDAILRARRTGKPVIAFGRDLIASMAYWTAALCDEIVATPTAMIGSIGILVAAYDSSKAYAEAGVRPDMIATDALKGVGQPGVEITPEWRAMVQRTVNETYGLMVDDIARHGLLKADAVRALGSRVFSGADARAAGLVASIETPEAFEARIGRAPTTSPSSTPSPTPTPTPAPTTGAHAPKAAPRGAGKDPMDYKDVTIADLRAQRPDLVASIATEAAAAAKAEYEAKATQPASFADLKANFGSDAAFIMHAQEKGLTLTAAHSEYAAKLAARNAELEKLKGSAPATNPAVGLSGSPKPGSGGEAPTFEGKVREVMATKNMAMIPAVGQVMQDFPSLHRDWHSRGCPGITPA